MGKYVTASLGFEDGWEKAICKEAEGDIGPRVTFVVACFAGSQAFPIEDAAKKIATNEADLKGATEIRTRRAVMKQRA